MATVSDLLNCENPGHMKAKCALLKKGGHKFPGYNDAKNKQKPQPQPPPQQPGKYDSKLQVKLYSCNEHSKRVSKQALEDDCEFG